MVGLFEPDHLQSFLKSNLSQVERMSLFYVSGFRFDRLLSRYKHTQVAHNTGVVCARVTRVHPALLQVELIVNVAIENKSHQLPIPTTGTLSFISQDATHPHTHTRSHMRTLSYKKAKINPSLFVSTPAYVELNFYHLPSEQDSAKFHR